MITDKDRSGWFGASDVSFITGNYETATFKKWWLEKLGLRKSNLNTKALRAGTYFEHKILDAIGVKDRDRQILLPEIKLRVNLDGEKDGVIYEVKTTKADNFKPSKYHREQVNVQMYATGFRKAYIVGYLLTDADYENYFSPIDTERIGLHKIEYNEEFITKFLSDIEYLSNCLEKGEMPKNEGKINLTAECNQEN